jgi:Holliday junction resolvase
MSMTPEAKVKKKVVALLKDAGAYYFYPVTGGYGKSGVPDIVACVNGMFVGIECKAGKNKPTPLQEKNLREIVEAGGAALVINETNIDLAATIISVLPIEIVEAGGAALVINETNIDLAATIIKDIKDKQPKL